MKFQKYRLFSLLSLFLLFLWTSNSASAGEVQNGLCFLKKQAEIEQFYRSGECAGQSHRISKGIGKGITIESDRVGVLFEFNSSAIEPAFYDLLAEWGRALQNLGDMKFRIHGHTDYIGSAEYNQQLSQQRAEIVRQYLMHNFAIDDSRLQVRAYGESQPLRGDANWQSDEDRYWNRRVEFVKVR